MGLFGWCKCKEPGCAAELFLPLFNAPESEDWHDWGVRFAREKGWWRDDNSWDARCPAHHPAVVQP